MSHLVHFLMDDGVEIVGDLWPADSPFTVMLLHGGGQTRHSWKAAGVSLSAAGVATLALDARGHGDSGWSPTKDYSRARLASDIATVARQQQTPVVLVGASMGGLAALLASAQLTADQLGGLVLVDVVPRYDAAGGQRVFDFMGANLDGFATLDDAAEAIAAYLPHRNRERGTRGLEKNLRQRGDRWFWHWDPEFLASSQLVGGGATRNDATLDRVARELTTPVLLLRGELSDVVSPAAAEAFVEMVPHALVVELSQAAHTAAADSNDEFTSAVIDFVQNHIPVETPNGEDSQGRAHR